MTRLLVRRMEQEMVPRPTDGSANVAAIVQEADAVDVSNAGEHSPADLPNEAALAVSFYLLYSLNQVEVNVTEMTLIISYYY